MRENKTNKEPMWLKKVKASIKNQKQYKIFESKQFLGLILLFLFSFLFVVSLVQLTGFTTINSYTIGMLFGYYSYFIYIAFIFLGLSWLFQIDIKIDKFIAKKFNKKFYFSWLPYLFFALGVALVSESIIKWVQTQTLFPGIKVFSKFFSDWWYNFTNNNNTIANSSAALPSIWNSGLIVSLFMSLIVCWSGYIVSMLIGLIFIAHFIFYVLNGSLIKIARVKIFGDPNKKDKIDKKDMSDYKTKIMDLSFEDSSGLIEKPSMDFLSKVEAKTSTISFDNPDDIFPINNQLNDVNDDSLNQSFIEEKTAQINLEKNLTQEFDINVIDSKQKQAFDIEEFNFELDIFKTETNSINVSLNDDTNTNNNEKDNDEKSI